MESNNLEKLVEELKTITPFKDFTEVGDVVLIASEQPRLILYAKVISVERDPSKKEEWWHIGLTFLTVPLQNVIWTLRTAQMTGQEIFTMGGEKRFFQAVVIGTETPLAPDSPQGRKTSRQKGSLKRIK
ncbi:MAG: hypothetical protein KJO60_16465 [Desulfofustis sp.]|nr:hypothetical protein [Desulfofustis sp.]NNK58173.1 hypothetical protein [Desulfofustis sp.]